MLLTRSPSKSSEFLRASDFSRRFCHNLVCATMRDKRHGRPSAGVHQHRYMASRFLDVPRKPLGLVLGAIFGVLALIDWAQVLLALLVHSDNPSTLIALHFGTGAAAAATCWGSWRKTRWTPIAAVAYGALTAALLLALPSLLELPLDARAGLRAGAT